MNKLVVLSVVFLSILGLFAPGSFHEASASAADFSVQAILPDNQKTKNISYFDFELLPNEAKKIEIEITNNAQEERLYYIEVNTATTNMNGVIDYTKQERKKDSSLLIDFADIATAEPTILISAGEVARVPIQLEMPNEQFEGILLGGVTVTESIEENVETTEITNHFSSSIGIVLSQEDSIPPIELNLLGVSKLQINKRNVLSGTVQNSVPTIVDNLSIDASIYRTGREKPIFHRAENGLRMAPNSNFDFGVGTNDQPLEAGQYIMNMTAKVGEQEWNWSEEFEITAQEARKLNDTAIVLEKKIPALYLWLAVGMVGIIGMLLITIIFLIKKKRNS